MSTDYDADVAIVGGGPAGLSAALLLGRSARKVTVFDRGSTRNAPSKTANGVFSRDGVPNRKLLKIARQQLSPYDVTLREEEISDIRHIENGFQLFSPAGAQAISRKVILCTGVMDILPEIPDIENFWGKSVVHCPYCHGWEFRNKPIAALVDRHTLLNFASLLYGWSSDMILLSHGPIDIDGEARKKIDAHGIPVVSQKITELVGTGGDLEQIVFENGKSLKREAIFIDPPQRLRSDLIGNLDPELNRDGRIETNRFGETSIPGIYAAGDAGPNMQQVTVAASSGTEIGIAINHKLTEEDFNDLP